MSASSKKNPQQQRQKKRLVNTLNPKYHPLTGVGCATDQLAKLTRGIRKLREETYAKAAEIDGQFSTGRREHDIVAMKLRVELDEQFDTILFSMFELDCKLKRFEDSVVEDQDAGDDDEDEDDSDE